jgi:hypothetical protein
MATSLLLVALLVFFFAAAAAQMPGEFSSSIHPSMCQYVMWLRRIGDLMNGISIIYHRR